MLMISNICDRMLAAGISQQIINDLMEDLLRQIQEQERLQREQEMAQRAAAKVDAAAEARQGDRFEPINVSGTCQSKLHYDVTTVSPSFGSDIPRGANVGFVNHAAIKARATTQELLDGARDFARLGDERFVDQLALATKANTDALKVGGGVPTFKDQFGNIAMIGYTEVNR